MVCDPVRMRVMRSSNDPARASAGQRADGVGLEYTLRAVTCVVSKPRMSGGDLILMPESAEDLFSADPILSEIDLRCPAAGRAAPGLGNLGPRPASRAVVIPRTRKHDP